MKFAKHIGPMTVVAIELCLPLAAMAGDDTPLAAVVTVPVVDATEAGEIAMPAPSLVLPGDDVGGSSSVAASPAPAPAVQTATPPTAATGNRTAMGLVGLDRQDEAEQRVSSGRWLQIGSNADPIRGRFRVNKSGALIGLAVGF